MTRKCKKKGHISHQHPSFLQLGLQTLNFARFSSMEWVVKGQERCQGSECSSQCALGECALLRQTVLMKEEPSALQWPPSSIW